MTITIREQRQVYLDEERIGFLGTWCCGTEFTPATAHRLVFTILKLKNNGRDDQRIVECIEEILQLDLDNLAGIFNYQHRDYRRERTFEEVKARFDEIAGEQ